MRYTADSSEIEDAVRAFPSGPLSLNFVDTVATHDGKSKYDHLKDFSSVIRWCQHAGVITAGQAKELSATAKRHPRQAAKVFSSALELRRAIYGIATGLSRGATPPRAELLRFNAILKRAMSHAVLAASGNGLSLDWHDAPDDLESPLWPIVRDAANLFTSDKIDRVVQCEGENCAWLFLDSTKNRSKRFCRSAGCGNRTRVRRFYERLRS